LGKIVEAVSGKSYDDNALELFKKAGMTQSSTGNTFKGNNFASAYLGNSNKFEEVPNMPKRLSGKEIGAPAGGFFQPFRIFILGIMHYMAEKS
jgi:CubicO group peptidase (beta-lactamase class C family)